MKRLLTIALAVSISTVDTMASEAMGDTQKRDRIHSVRKAVDGVGKLEVKDISVVSEFKKMFSDGKVSGQLRLLSAGYIQESPTLSNTYATAIGGILKYELAKYNGFNAGVALYTSHDIDSFSGDKNKHNSELSSSNASYSEVGEAYLNYSYEDFNFRAGRQILDTPLADSDDIRMVQNSFHAYIASYRYNKIDFIAGNIQSWQGTDAALDNGWSEIGDNGANFVGASMHDGFEFNAWYYNITAKTDAIYLDAGFEYEIDKDMMIHFLLQYLNEDEIASSNVSADIYGGLFEFVFHGIGLNVAFNKALKQQGKESFSGVGGGAMFTSMDTTTIDVITQDRDAFAAVFGIAYDLENFNFIYAYGDFKGDKNSQGEKAHIVEQNAGFEYNVNDEFLLSALYVNVSDRVKREKTENDWDRAQVMINYNF